MSKHRSFVILNIGPNNILCLYHTHSHTSHFPRSQVRCLQLSAFHYFSCFPPPRHLQPSPKTAMQQQPSLSACPLHTKTRSSLHFRGVRAAKRNQVFVFLVSNLSTARQPLKINGFFWIRRSRVGRFWSQAKDDKRNPDLGDR